MDFTVLIPLFKMLAPDLANFTDDVIISWLELAEPHVSKCRFGSLYNQALVYYTAYMVELSQEIEQGGGGGSGGSVTAGEIASRKEGDLAITYTTSSSNSSGNNDSTLAKNIYGQQFNDLAKKVGGGTVMTRFTRCGYCHV